MIGYLYLIIFSLVSAVSVLPWSYTTARAVLLILGYWCRYLCCGCYYYALVFITAMTLSMCIAVFRPCTSLLPDNMNIKDYSEDAAAPRRGCVSYVVLVYDTRSIT